MKKLALALTFVFGVAMIAPAFAIDKPKEGKKVEVAKTCTGTDAKAGCSKECAKACEKAEKSCDKAAPAKAEPKK
jgi:hypothetical protein